MQEFSKFVNHIPFSIVIVFCLTIGLAPFNPPHIWEKLQMLVKGQLIRPLDWFDLFLHGAPWILLILKIGYVLKGNNAV